MTAPGRRPALVLVLVLLAFAMPLAAPIGIARACACGVYSPAVGGDARVPHETALVRAPGDGTEDIYLALTLDSNVRTGALLFPVPDRKATVSAGPRTLFPTLQRLTKPVPSHDNSGLPGAGAGAPPSVTVENRQTIGPLDVVTLSSTDPAALTAWLQHNGFTAKPALTRAARPYTSAGWAFVAVRLKPGTATATSLSGQLEPLHIHLRTADLVYPMRLSAMATTPDQVTVYTLSRHGLAMDTTTTGMSVSYRGVLDAAAHPELADVTAGGTTVLTRLDGRLLPANIDDDFHFTAATTDVRSSAPPSAPPSGPTNHADDGFTRPATTSNRTTQTIVIVTGTVVLLALIGAGYLLHQRRGPRIR